MAQVECSDAIDSWSLAFLFGKSFNKLLCVCLGLYSRDTSIPKITIIRIWYLTNHYKHLSPLDESKSNQIAAAGKLNTLWIYGDSVGDFFYKSITKQPLCKQIFQRCNNTYNWVYTIKERNLTRARLENDDKDFSIRRVITEIFQAISQPSMKDKNSALILNLGLHYVHTINFTTYMRLIDNTIRLLTEKFNTDKIAWRFRGKLIWKTTTAINKEKYGDPRTNARHSTSIRFLTYQVRLWQLTNIELLLTVNVFKPPQYWQ